MLGLTRECSPISLAPPSAKGISVVRLHQRVHAPAESRTERRRGDGAELTRTAGKLDRLGYLIAQQSFGVGLRAVDELAEPIEIAATQRVASLLNDLQFGAELLDTLQQQVGGER